MAQLMIQATALAQAEAFRYGRRVAGRGDHVWVALETVGHIQRGSMQVPSAQSVLSEDRGVLIVEAQPGPGLLWAAIRRLARDQLDDVLKQMGIGAKEETDARVLPVGFKDGKRGRKFAEVVELSQQVDFKDWAVAGPRRAGWCLTFLVKRGGPLAHHEWWRSVGKLSETNVGVLEHERIMRSVMHLTEYD